MDEMTEVEISRNKAIRGYIMRSLVKGYQNTLLVRQISKHLDYLRDGGYITFTDKSVNAYNAYRKDAVIKLTKEGVDLVEGTTDDPGVDI